VENYGQPSEMIAGLYLIGVYLLELIEFIRSNLDLSIITDGLRRVLAVLLCLTVHESCHGLAAYALGDPTAKARRRISLNPLRHIDWLGLASMVFLGFGWAKPVPVNAAYFRNPKAGMALTALAGPASNFLLAVLAVFGMGYLIDNSVAAAGFDLWFFYFLMDLAILSIGLGIFNLIPIPPLDGSKVLAVVLPDRAYMTLMRYERYGILLLLVIMYLDVGSSVLSSAIVGVYTFLVNLIL